MSTVEGSERVGVCGSVIAEERLRPLSRDELERYHRNALVPQVGLVGQQRIRASRVLLIGAGGLGAPAALYLAAAGVGTIGLIDDDNVDVSNLQRQVIHATAAVGRPKVDSAAEAIRALNPDVEVVAHRTRLTADNARDLLGGWDVVIDGTDNFPTRYLVNDATVMLGLPLVHGAVLGFNGQVGVFDARRGPCYRCLHPTPPPAGSVPSCAEAGVLGVLPGIIGTMQAAEALKLIVGGAQPLIGRMVLLNAWSGRGGELPVDKNPACPVCGDVFGKGGRRRVELGVREGGGPILHGHSIRGGCCMRRHGAHHILCSGGYLRQVWYLHALNWVDGRIPPFFKHTLCCCRAQGRVSEFQRQLGILFRFLQGQHRIKRCCTGMHEHAH